MASKTDVARLHEATKGAKARTGKIIGTKVKGGRYTVVEVRYSKGTGNVSWEIPLSPPELTIDEAIERLNQIIG